MSEVSHMIEVLGTFERRSTCPRRQVAAIIVSKRNLILGTGFNGVPRGYVHCTDSPCPGYQDPSGSSANCAAVHAEQNAIINCQNMDLAYRIYCSTLPCFMCMKMIINTPISEIIYVDSYPDTRGYQMARELGLKILKYPEEIR